MILERVREHQQGFEGRFYNPIDSSTELKIVRNTYIIYKGIRILPCTISGRIQNLNRV